MRRAFFPPCLWKSGGWADQNCCSLRQKFSILTADIMLCDVSTGNIFTTWNGFWQSILSYLHFIPFLVWSSFSEEIQLVLLALKDMSSGELNGDGKSGCVLVLPWMCPRHWGEFTWLLCVDPPPAGLKWGSENNTSCPCAKGYLKSHRCRERGRGTQGLWGLMACNLLHSLSIFVISVDEVTRASWV